MAHSGCQPLMDSLGRTEELAHRARRCVRTSRRSSGSGSASAGRTDTRVGTRPVNEEKSDGSDVIHHKVRDYAAWRPAYDAHEPSRAGAGITNGRVYRKAEDSNDLVILFDIADVARARAWTAGEDLKTVMGKAGVLGAPTIHFIG